MNDHILEAVKTIEHYNDYISSTADRLKELVVESLSLTETVHDIQKKLGDDWIIDFRYRGTFDG